MDRILIYKRKYINTEDLKEKNIFLVVGTRPNFMKIAPLVNEFQKEKIKFKIIHTGQHYDYNMSKIFFKELKIPEPDYFLGVRTKTMNLQTAKIMNKFKKVLLNDPPILILVVGDVTSTISCALTGKLLGFKVGHIEAGLRSFDYSMPEEMNRVLTDQISDLLFTTEKSGNLNLAKEGISPEKIFFVGNIMIDTLISNLKKVKKQDQKEEYVLFTAHRPSNVDSKESLLKIVKIVNLLAEKIKVIFPIHPRTKKNIKKYSLEYSLDNKFNENIQIMDPVGYLEFLELMVNSKFIVSDSGGIQEEASFLKIPILTIRDNTERPITVEQGTNEIVGRDMGKILFFMNKILSGNFKKGKEIEKWDGQTAKRITKIIKRIIEQKKQTFK